MSALHAYSYRAGNCNCLLQNTARWLSTANNLSEFFVHAVLSLILDHGVPFIISVSGLKNSSIADSARYFFFTIVLMSSNGIFVIDNKIPSHFESNS